MNWRHFRAWLRTAFLGGLILTLLGNSIVPPADEKERIRSYTRAMEFDYINWTLDALWSKGKQAALSLPAYLHSDAPSQIVNEYLELVRQISEIEAEIDAIYADPHVVDPERVSAGTRARLANLQEERRKLGPLAETVIQHQLGVVLQEEGLDLGGQSIPPILYEVTPLPMALIVSPRYEIRQDANISLQPDMMIEQVTQLENDVATALDVSTLVTEVGGIGAYPTMVMNTTDLNFLVEVVAHEWTHNYLTLRPLGVNYETTPELRTMNETTASIAGKELGARVIERFYPQMARTAASKKRLARQVSVDGKDDAFDFRAEMRVTRLQVDALLAEGKIVEAEAYMEKRRQVFWENGFQIRRLNQAYFAFHGAYADEPGGAAGEDPVGEAVRELRRRSENLATFVNRMSWFMSYERLERELAQGD